MNTNKVIIVEGLSDKKKVMNTINEPIQIICTNGTIGLTRLDELVEKYEDKDVYILVDADAPGEKLRKKLKQGFPLAYNLYIANKYKEVAEAPYDHLAAILQKAHFEVRTEYLYKG